MSILKRIFRLFKKVEPTFLEWYPEIVYWKNDDILALTGVEKDVYSRNNRTLYGRVAYITQGGVIGVYINNGYSATPVFEVNPMKRINETTLAINLKISSHFTYQTQVTDFNINQITNLDCGARIAKSFEELREIISGLQ